MIDSRWLSPFGSEAVHDPVVRAPRVEVREHGVVDVVDELGVAPFVDHVADHRPPPLASGRRRDLAGGLAVAEVDVALLVVADVEHVAEDLLLGGDPAVEQRARRAAGGDHAGEVVPDVDLAVDVAEVTGGLRVRGRPRGTTRRTPPGRSSSCTGGPSGRAPGGSGPRDSSARSASSGRRGGRRAAPASGSGLMNTNPPQVSTFASGRENSSGVDVLEVPTRRDRPAARRRAPRSSRGRGSGTPSTDRRDP